MKMIGDMAPARRAAMIEEDASRRPPDRTHEFWGAVRPVARAGVVVVAVHRRPARLSALRRGRVIQAIKAELARDNRGNADVIAKNADVESRLEGGIQR